MDTHSIKKLDEIFRVVFNLPETSDVREVRQASEHGWDSLGHLSLVSAIESEFNVTLGAADTLRMTSYETTRIVLEEMGL
jgi:acyl carrier protein